MYTVIPQQPGYGNRLSPPMDMGTASLHIWEIKPEEYIGIKPKLFPLLLPMWG